MLKSDGIMCIDFTFQGTDHHVLPVFTSPDAAVMFSGGLEHDGDKIRLTHVDSISKINDLKRLLSFGEIELVVLDPPNLDDDESRLDVTHWVSEDFVNLFDSLNKISEEYDEKKAISTLDTYLHGIQNGEDPPEFKAE